MDQLERILGSGDFDASPRSRAFVRFIVEETLAGRAEGLTQSAIATRVFGRREDFDPTVDPIVRIQAGRLRRSLERYYLLSGAGDSARNPGHIPVALHALWADHLRREEYEEAYQVALLYRDPAFFWRALMQAAFLGHLGRIAEAKHEAAELLKAKPDFASRGRTLIGRYIKFPDLHERIVVGLGKAGLALD